MKQQKDEMKISMSFFEKLDLNKNFNTNKYFSPGLKNCHFLTTMKCLEINKLRSGTSIIIIIIIGHLVSLQSE